ncbi:hypothetical protein P7L53_07445 [Thermoleptolyngbya sichuanensis XZ-Cy5]|nr:hypothetical protein [Thermoleptolyngbya sichuanensis XZ-Cy5]
MWLTLASPRKTPGDGNSDLLFAPFQLVGWLFVKHTVSFTLSTLKCDRPPQAVHGTIAPIHQICSAKTSYFLISRRHLQFRLNEAGLW